MPDVQAKAQDDPTSVPGAGGGTADEKLSPRPSVEAAISAVGGEPDSARARRNPIFSDLVQGEEDLPGLVGYALYKLSKRDWLAAFAETHRREPTQDEIELLHPGRAHSAQARDLSAARRGAHHPQDRGRGETSAAGGRRHFGNSAAPCHGGEGQFASFLTGPRGVKRRRCEVFVQQTHGEWQLAPLRRDDNDLLAFRASRAGRLGLGLRELSLAPPRVHGMNRIAA